MLEEIGKMIIHAGIVQGVFATILFLTRKESNTKSLIPIVACFSVIISHSYIIGHLAGLYIKSPFIIAEPFIFLISPFLYFHFRKIANSKWKFQFHDFIHLLPFFLFFISFIPIYLHGKQTLYYNFLYENPVVITAFLWIILIVQFLYYWRKLRVLNVAYISRLQEERSQYQEFDASWIRTFMILFLIIFAFVLLILAVFIHEGNFENFNQIVPVFFSLALFFITFKGLNQKIIPTREYEKLEDGATKVFTDEKALVMKEQLIEFMQRDKLYLNPELTLNELALQFGITRNQLSYLINNSFDSNFYLFVNDYRVSHVKELLQKDKKKRFTILAHAFDSGFNSKSSFNAIFKKITGLTPSGYRDGLN